MPLSSYFFEHKDCRHVPKIAIQVFNNFHCNHSEDISKNCSLRILSFRRFEKVPEEIKPIFLAEINFQIY